jgi:hypothetical protein
LPSLNIVQIGAYIGDTVNDPLARFIKETLPKRRNARVILVEPVKSFFEKLKQNYDEIPGLIFENVAIAENEGEREFHRLSVDPADYGFPDCVAQLGSLRPDRMTTLWENYSFADFGWITFSFSDGHLCGLATLGPYRVAGALGQEARYPFPLRQRAPATWLASSDIGRSYLSRCFIRGIHQCGARCIALVIFLTGSGLSTNTKIR